MLWCCWDVLKYESHPSEGLSSPSTAAGSHPRLFHETHSKSHLSSAKFQVLELGAFGIVWECVFGIRSILQRELGLVLHEG